MVWEKLCEIKGRLREGTTACTSIDETGNVSRRMMIGMNHGEVTCVTATYCLQVTAERCWGFRVLSPEVTKGCAAELLYWLQSQRFFKMTLLPCRGSFCIGHQYRRRARGGRQSVLKKNLRKWIHAWESVMVILA